MVGSSDFGHIPIFDGEIPHSQRLLLKSNMWNLFGWSTCPKHKTKLWCSNSHHFPPFFGCVQFLSVSFRVFFFFRRSMERWAPPCSSSLVLRSLPPSAWGNNTRVNRTLGRFWGRFWSILAEFWQNLWWLLQTFVVFWVRFMTLTTSFSRKESTGRLGGGVSKLGTQIYGSFRIEIDDNLLEGAGLADFCRLTVFNF